MLDLRVVKPLDLAKIRSVDYLGEEQLKDSFLLVPGEPYPVVLDIIGENFQNVEAVLLNNNEIRYRMVSTTRIWATVPEIMIGQPIRDLFVITSKEDYSNVTSFIYEVGKTATFVSGIQKLIGQFVFLLLKTPDSGVFARGKGGGLLSIIGTNPNQKFQATTLVAQRILNTGDQLRESQAGSDLPSSEKLRSVTILNIGNTKGDPTSISVSLKITTMAGGDMLTNLQFGAQNLAENLGT